MSVVGVSPGSPEAAAPRALQPVAAYSPSTGAVVAPPIVAADGSQPISGVNGTSKASLANPVPTSSTVGGVAVSSTNPEPVKQYGFGTIAATQVDVTTAQVTVIGARATRSYVMLQNLGTTPVYFGSGSPAVSSTNSFMLPGVIGATVTIPTTSSIVATAAVTQRIAVIEGF